MAQQTHAVGLIESDAEPDDPRRRRFVYTAAMIAAAAELALAPNRPRHPTDALSPVIMRASNSLGAAGEP